MQLQDFSVDIKNLKERLETDPDNIELLLQLVELYLKVEGDEYYNSVLTLDKILELDPNNFAANRIRGLIYKELDNYEDAIGCYELILKTYTYAKDHPEYREIRFDYAEMLEALERDEDALVVFEELKLETPDNIAVIFKLAHFYTILERFDEAISSYKRILELDPENEAALSQLVELYEGVDKALYHSTQAELALKEGRTSKALSEYKKLLNHLSEPQEECDVRIKIANILLKEGDLAHSLDEFNLALDICDDSSEAYKGLGKVYVENEEFEEAIECFTKALEINSNDYDIYIELSDAYVELERYPEAVRELETVKKYMPDNMEVRCNLAEGHIILRDLYKAKQEIDFVLAREPENTMALGALVDLNLEKEDFEAALEVSRKIVKIVPNSAFSARKMAEAYDSLGDKYNASYNYGLAYELGSDYGMAIDSYQTALELEENNADLLMKIGDLYISMGEKYVGIEYYEKASEADEENTIPLFKLAEFYGDNGEVDKSTDAYERLVEIEPRNSEAVYNLAVLYDKQKYTENALEMYLRYLELAPNSTNADNVKKKIEKYERKLGRKTDDDYVDDGEYEEYIDDRTIFQKIKDLFVK